MMSRLEGIVAGFTPGVGLKIYLTGWLLSEGQRAALGCGEVCVSQQPLSNAGPANPPAPCPAALLLMQATAWAARWRCWQRRTRPAASLRQTSLATHTALQR